MELFVNCMMPQIVQNEQKEGPLALEPCLT